ncbi:MAG: glycoside hydrolase family 57 protein [Candidatus Caenarcaniphilales bacterium]|nr:glycoside hydrolase family 57 protein [Candidatus Caenarcaniphilales bacterium]
MVSICFYFQVHQPDRLRDYRIFDIGHSPFYLDQGKNEAIMRKVANKCYLPMNYMLKEMIESTGGAFKCAFSFSGTFLEQAELFAPDVLSSFQDLIKTGCVEVLSETYYHSLAFLYSVDEWKEQIRQHKAKVKELFNVEPKVFRNTELIYSDWIGEQVAEMGYKGMLAEGVDWNLDWRSPNFIYRNPRRPELALLLKNYRLADDIAFRFSNRQWIEWPLTCEKYLDWMDIAGLNGYIVNLFMDYETFGEHQWADSGIFDFMKALPHQALSRGHHDFVTPSEAFARFESVSTYHADKITSWADLERDLSAWKSNRLQDDAFDRIYQLEQTVKETQDPNLIKVWRRLTTSDHFYYMCTKYYSDGDVHQYFSPYESPYDAYINYMNVISDLTIRLRDYKMRQSLEEERRDKQLSVA